MTLIKSISGIRGTIGGKPGEGLTPVDIVGFAAGYGAWVKRRNASTAVTVVVGRDSRVSGPVVRDLIIGTLVCMGIDVTDLDQATTPTVEVAVTGLNASGGIIITASHNPGEWNALKLLNEKGEFLSAEDGAEVLRLSSAMPIPFVAAAELGTVTSDSSWNRKHIEMIVSGSRIKREEISSAGLTVVIDCVNSVGGTIIPDLLRELGVKKIIELHCNADGRFPHNPEPLAENLRDLSEAVVRERADIGFVVDPDVDRLAMACEDGTMFGEEYTLVAVADYVLSQSRGAAVSNMSSSMALRDVAALHGCSYYSSAVGEVNVVEEMKKRKAVIGGEGNGGVILPELHYGRDALVGIALFLSHYVTVGLKCSELKQRYPQYVISKKKLTLPEGFAPDQLYAFLRDSYAGMRIDDRDGIKIEMDNGWVHLRASNTEAVLRIYAEAGSDDEAEKLSNEVAERVKKL